MSIITTLNQVRDTDIDTDQLKGLGDSDPNTHTESNPIQFIEVVNVSAEKKKIQFIYTGFVDLLKELGFYRYDKDGEFFIVRIQDNVVSECSKEEVIDVFEDFITNRPYGEWHNDVKDLAESMEKKPAELIRNKMLGAIGTYFSDRILGRLRPDKPIEFNEHSKDKAYFYYQNGYVEVSREGIELKQYTNLDGYIWKNQMLKRDFKQIPRQEYEKSTYFQFLKNISNNWNGKHPKTGEENNNLDPLRLQSFQTVIGYLLHSYFARQLKAVIFTDSKVDPTGEANGRTGKTLLLKSLGYALNMDPKKSKTYVEINGKDFKTEEKFKYQELGLDTRLVHINDTKRNFKFEDLFNDITEGIRRERKNESPSIIQTKLAISTNKTIKIRGASAKGRSIEVELAEYYDDTWSPDQEFNQWFFVDWTEYEWQMFDNIIMECVRLYLDKGIIEPSRINLLMRKKIEETSPEFVNWMEDKAFKDGDRKNKKELYEEFIDRYEDFKNWLTQRSFTKWVKVYCEYDEDYNEPIESRSNGADYIEFKKNEEPEKNNTDDEVPF